MNEDLFKISFRVSTVRMKFKGGTAIDVRRKIYSSEDLKIFGIKK